MQIFNLVLTQMLMMFTLMAVGFFLRKKGIVTENAHVTLSKMETFAFLPALNFLNQLQYCTVDNFKKYWTFMLYGLVLILIAILAAYPLSSLFIRKRTGDSAENYQRNIYKYAMAFGNYGFMGNFIVLGIWGEEMFFKYTMFTFFVTVFCYGWGLCILIPKEAGGSVAMGLKKGLLSPPMIAVILGMAGGLLGIHKYLPDFLNNAMSSASKCMGPVAMLLAGMVIGNYEFKKMFTDKKVYIASLLRLIVIPAVFVLVLKLIGTNDEIVSLAFIAFATPLGLNTIVYPSAYGGDPRTGASMATVSHTLSVITIPLMYLLLVVLL